VGTYKARDSTLHLSLSLSLSFMFIAISPTASLLQCRITRILLVYIFNASVFELSTSYKQVTLSKQVSNITIQCYAILVFFLTVSWHWSNTYRRSPAAVIISSGDSVRSLISSIMMQLTSAFILSRLDHCNIILARLLKSLIATLQRKTSNFYIHFHFHRVVPVCGQLQQLNMWSPN